ncbi:peptide chain release factor N(5)-glutamine methyltransferase [Ovoidimarina sediminis]|uniref:peptide chain release factor N(5)-glutamine methyltransferase n=1 Tax=Ovoidimarina sediminis TaxID=3079856 RepID=UPI002908E192|nr:peptide chain release factor N(5)-glutamine methyltransferase [Rhodophyticola sp. MJ-SS7]MDU8945660.1 peptide chain release factor N(5)-glutamine methyltransferase [Rhodophyticola sp. MJ-SS7]
MTRDEARRILKEAGVADPGGDVRRLYDYAMWMGEKIGGQDRDTPNSLTLTTFANSVRRRAKREPVSHITGFRAFWKTEFFGISGDVLDPRPETEALVDLALQAPFTRLLDLGTGSGCIAISLLLERPAATGLATDISPAALAVAKRNASFRKIDDRLDFAISDWLGAVEGEFDLIVSNPPYIAAGEMPDLAPEVREWEPRVALTDEADGLTAYRAIAAGASRHLTPGGRLLVEIGHMQGAAVSEIFRAAGLEDVAVQPDLDGRNRVVSARG